MSLMNCLHGCCNIRGLAKGYDGVGLLPILFVYFSKLKDTCTVFMPWYEA
ncbi:hypothetical protein [Bartonella massiliensis]|nr:hypothetical protein [Bartonella massiliensis]